MITCPSSNNVKHGMVVHANFLRNVIIRQWYRSDQWGWEVGCKVRAAGGRPHAGVRDVAAVPVPGLRRGPSKRPPPAPAQCHQLQGVLSGRSHCTGLSCDLGLAHERSRAKCCQSANCPNSFTQVTVRPPVDVRDAQPGECEARQAGVRLQQGVPAVAGRLGGRILWLDRDCGCRNKFRLTSGTDCMYFY